MNIKRTLLHTNTSTDTYKQHIPYTLHSVYYTYPLLIHTNTHTHTQYTLHTQAHLHITHTSISQTVIIFNQLSVLINS